MNGSVEFIYDKSTRRPRRLQNNVFVLYTPEKVIIRPGKINTIKTKLKIRLLKNLVDCCVLLTAFSDNGIKLLNYQHISSETNFSRSNQPVDLPWYLTLEIFNQNMNTVFQLNKKQEMGFFHILNDGGEEIRHIYKKEH